MTREIKIEIGDPYKPIGYQLHWKGLDYDTDEINRLNDCGVGAKMLFEEHLISNTEYLEICELIIRRINANVKKKNKMAVILTL